MSTVGLTSFPTPKRQSFANKTKTSSVGMGFGFFQYTPVKLTMVQFPANLIYTSCNASVFFVCYSALGPTSISGAGFSGMQFSSKAIFTVRFQRLEKYQGQVADIYFKS